MLLEQLAESSVAFLSLKSFLVDDSDMQKNSKVKYRTTVASLARPWYFYEALDVVPF